MLKEGLIGELKSSEKFFNKSTSCLEEKDSNFAPKEGLFTVANHVAHAALSLEWFMDGVFNPKGFNMDFEAHVAEVKSCTSLQVARDRFKRAYAAAVETVSSKSDEELQAPLPEGPIMGGVPRLAAISSISEHTAHHRGALSVYSRLLGKEPEMPY